jgi:CelD/BcsL family acetyltransferase involved in cellulose biosynthesis
MLITYRETSIEKIGQKDWNNLIQTNKVNTVYQTYQWHRALWEVHQKDYELFLLCVKEDEKLVGIAPLMRKIKDNIKILLFIGNYQADYSDFIYQDGKLNILNEIINWLQYHRDTWDRLQLLNIPDYSPSGSIILELSKNTGWPTLANTCAVCPAWQFDERRNSIKEIINKKSLKRHYNYFKNLPGFEVLHLTSSEDILPYMEEYFQQHIERRYVIGERSLFLEDDIKQFYLNLVAVFDKSNLLIFTIIKSQGKNIAFHLGYNYNKKFIWYKPSFDINLFKHYPGEVLLNELFQYAASSRCHEFDLTIGNEHFKERFSNIVRKNYLYQVYQKQEDMPTIEPRYNRIQHFFIRIKNIIKECGIFKGIWKIFSIIGERSFEYESVNYFSIPSYVPAPQTVKPILENFIMRQAGVKDIFRLNYFKRIEQRLEYYKCAFERLLKGEILLIIEHNGNIVSFAWISRGNKFFISEVDTMIALQEGAIIIYDCRTLPEYYGKHLYRFILCKIIDDYIDEEKIIYCRKNNLPSLKVITTIFKLNKKLFYMRLFKMKLRWSKK